LITEKVDTNIFKTIVNRGKRLPENSVIEYDFGLKAKVLDILETGERVIRFESETPVDDIIASQGQVPLPPYIHEKLDNYDRYQTVYAKTPGSCAAPTAGLHFTTELLEKLKAKTDTAFVTLNVGIGTFRPIKTDNIDDHIMHSEFYSIPEETKNKIQNCKGRIISVGTTSTRALETASTGHRELTKLEGDSQLFIRPGYKFKTVDCLITNFHIPKSTLLLLVSALAGKENIFNAYRKAVELKYHFFSFGDAMFITDNEVQL
ncbi:MAG: tRNA preQ1(34) S-adenosylmethionine ribosyltransferase-isomerase QueA, partial [Armatimonadetes bacterium]|nr:tRNA preQ1(34) S-adenosylmethionine ribosyltransferase-isomerase QueA [Candidatus Hippobium faecium]